MDSNVNYDKIIDFDSSLRNPQYNDEKKDIEEFLKKLKMKLKQDQWSDRTKGNVTYL